MAAEWFRYHADDACLTLRIHAQPNARSTGTAGLHGDALKIRIAAPAADDRANAALLAWLADALVVPRSTLRLKSGKTSRRKVIEIRPASAQLVSRAAALAA